MKNFKDGFSDFGKANNFKGRPKFGGNREGQGSSRFGNNSRTGGKSSGQTELFTATCTTCHKSCEVPFRPNGEKPVYCSACFGKNRDDNEKAERGGQRNDTRSFRPQPQMDAVSKGDILQIKQQLSKLELQLNRVLEFVNPPVPKVRKEVEPEAVVVEAEVAPVVKEAKPRKPKATKKAAVKKAVKKKK